MRALLVVVLCCLAGVPAVGAINTLPPPVVVVYPLATSGTADPQAGGRLAILFASRLASAGGLSIKPATPGTTRAQYLAAARALGADYYVTGFMTPLGNEVSLVDQLVSTYSGIVVWSNTTQVRTYDEAAGQADLLHDAILRHAGRTLAALDQPAPLPSATATPPANGGNLTKMFSRRPKPTAAPKPAPSATATATATAGALAAASRAPVPSPAASRAPIPSPAASRAPVPQPAASPVSSGPSALPPSAAPGYPVATHAAAIVVQIGGDAEQQERSYASTALSAALAKQGLGGALIATSSSGDLPTHAPDLCKSSGATSIFAGTLAVRHVGGGFLRGATADFELLRYDCSGTVTAREHVQTQASGKSDTTVAIDRAISKTLDAALRHPKTKA